MHSMGKALLVATVAWVVGCEGGKCQWSQAKRATVCTKDSKESGASPAAGDRLGVNAPMPRPAAEPPSAGASTPDRSPPPSASNALKRQAGKATLKEEHGGPAEHDDVSPRGYTLAPPTGGTSATPQPPPGKKLPPLALAGAAAQGDRQGAKAAVILPSPVEAASASAVPASAASTTDAAAGASAVIASAGSVSSIVDPEARRRAALADGIARAALYHSPACVAARNMTSFKGLQQIVPWEVQEARVMASGGLASELWPHPKGPRPRTVYIRNQKVASTMLAEQTEAYSGVVAQKFDFNMRRARGLPRAVAAASGATGPTHDPRGAHAIAGNPHIPCGSHVFFTVVREPIGTFIAGWQQVMCFLKHQAKRQRIPVGNHSLLGSGSDVPWAYRDARAQFRAFLNDFEARRYLGPSATHVYPQADKVDALPRGCSYAFIGRLETLKDSMAALFPATAIKSSPRHLPPHGHKAEDEDCKRAMMATFGKLGQEETKQLCRVLYADFTCFGYPFPPECTSAQAIHTNTPQTHPQSILQTPLKARAKKGAEKKR